MTDLSLDPHNIGVLLRKKYRAPINWGKPQFFEQQFDNDNENENEDDNENKNDNENADF